MTKAASTDPRTRQDGLGWITRAVFGDPRLHLAVHGRGDTPPVADAAATIRYAVVPSLERPRFLLPLVSRRVGFASTVAYNALRPARVRLNRLAAGVVAGLGVTRLARMPVLTVTVPAGVDPAEVLLVDMLAERLGDRLHAAVGIRPPDPHHKPTLQLFDDRGRPRGYAKVGWNSATRDMVRTEAGALRELPRRGAGLPDAPRLSHLLETADRTVAVVEPMPAGVRRIDRPDRPRLDAMLAVARRGGPGRVAVPLAGSGFLATLTERAATQERSRAIVAALAAGHGDTTVEYGDWHGDWVPWNLGRHGDRLIAWDWENRGTDVPIGFDLAHQAFQTELSLHGGSARDAAGQMDAWLQRHGAALGLSVAGRRLVADAYLVELWLRTAEIAAGGAGWNERLHPHLLDLLEERLGRPVMALVTAE